MEYNIIILESRRSISKGYFSEDGASEFQLYATMLERPSKIVSSPLSVRSIYIQDIGYLPKKIVS